MADRICELCIGCCSAICAVFCRNMPMKTSFLIQFVIYGVFQGYNVASDIGMFFDVFSAVEKCDTLGTSSSGLNSTNGPKIYCREHGNFTFSDLEKHVTALQILQWLFLIFAAFGVSVYIAHLCTLIPNLCKHCFDPGFEHDVASSDIPNYYRNIIQIHTVFMIIESFIHDIPASCLAMELSVHYFGPAEINCWECAVSASSVPGELSLKRGSLWIGLKVSAVALISIYKGILPLFFWIGNPFCWSCYPVRFLIASPAGLLFMVMTLTPCMGVAKYRVMVKAPAMKSQLDSVSDIIWTIGLLFWVIAIVMILMYTLCKKFIFELCPCLSWCVDEDSQKKKSEKKTSTGCLCF